MTRFTNNNKLSLPIAGYENYTINTSGEVFNIKTKNKLKTWITKNGYEQVCLYKDNKRKHKAIHRLVAEAFLKKETGKDYVNHIDGNKSNNSVSNIEWCNSSHNTKHSCYVLGNQVRKVAMMDIDFKIIKIFNSILEARAITGIDNSAISKCCRGKLKTSGGYIWRYQK